MTDGFYFYPRNTQWQTGTQESEAAPEPQIDLSTSAQWITLQPISTHIALLELIANDLYRRREFPSLASEIKHCAKDLLTLSRHQPHVDETR